MNSDTLYFVELFGKLFASSAPIAVMAIFLAMTPGYTPKERWKTAFKASNVSLGILLLCALFGNRLLELLGVDMNAFRIAGGLVLGFIGLDMVQSSNNEEKKEKGAPPPRRDIVVTPLAFPVISGPGAISALMITKSEATNQTQELYAYGSLFALMALFYVLFFLVSFCSKWLTPAFINITTKLFGLVVVAMSVQFIASGILGFAQS